MGLFDDEIREQPVALARLLEGGRDDARALGVRIRAYAPRFVVIAARGSSDNAARYAQYLLGAANGVTTALAAPSLFTLYGAKPSMREALVVGVSQSGRSPDVVAVLAEARAQGALTIALTNADDSPLERAAEHRFALRAGVERAVPASKTYTNQLLAFALLSAAWANDADAFVALDHAPGLAARTLTSTIPPLDAWARAERIAVLARGTCFGTAHEVALKLKECARVAAEPHSIADFAHGPIAAGATHAIVIAPSSRADADLDAVLARLAGVTVCAISDRDDVLGRVALPIRVPRAAETLAPITCAVAGQLVAAALARTRGLDPDAPAGLQKVTETR